MRGGKIAGEVYHWEILPRAGVGDLKFGATQSSVDSHARAYGNIVRSGSDRIPDSILQDTLAQFGDSLSESEKQELIELYSASGPDSTSITEVRGDRGLVLRYEKDRLVEIILSVDHKLANLGGVDVFAHPSERVLSQAEQMNGVPGRYSGTSAIFDSIGIVFEGFCVTNKGSKPKPLNGRDDRFMSRTIGVFEKIDDPQMQGFERFSWI